MASAKKSYTLKFVENEKIIASWQVLKYLGFKNLKESYKFLNQQKFY